MEVLFSLLGLLCGVLMVVGGLVAVLALRNVASVVLLVGSGLGLLNALGWMVIQFLQRSGSMDWGSGFFIGMRILGNLSWLLTAVGVLLLALAASGLRKRNLAMESIVAGSQTDRVA